MLDRIDIHIQVLRVENEKLSDSRIGESSTAVRARVEAACSLLKTAMQQLQLSARAYQRVIKLVRTIANLAPNLAEAMQ